MRQVFLTGNFYEFFSINDCDEVTTKYAVRIFSDVNQKTKHIVYYLNRDELEHLRDALDVELGPK